MTTYKFADHLLLRIPAKGYHIGQDVNVRKLLDEPFFLSAIYLTSPGFYRRLELADFNPERLNTRELNTLKKYHNRMRFRPTPFGLFATVGLSTWSEQHGTVLNPTFYHTHICAGQALEVIVGEDLFDPSACCKPCR